MEGRTGGTASAYAADQLHRTMDSLTCFAASQGACTIKGIKISDDECKAYRFRRPERDVTNGKRYPVNASYGRPDGKR